MHRSIVNRFKLRFYRIELLNDDAENQDGNKRTQCAKKMNDEVDVRWTLNVE